MTKEELWLVHKVVNERAQEIIAQWRVPTAKDYFGSYFFYPPSLTIVKKFETDLAYVKALNQFCEELKEKIERY